MSTTANAPFILYTEATPSGKKVSVHLEELKSIYGDKVEYECVERFIGLPSLPQIIYPPSSELNTSPSELACRKNRGSSTP
jgi:hypothetical protein